MTRMPHKMQIKKNILYDNFNHNSTESHLFLNLEFLTSAYYNRESSWQKWHPGRKSITAPYAGFRFRISSI